MPIVITPVDEQIDIISDTFKDTSLNGSLLDDSSLSGETEEVACPICNKPYYSTPRILSCLHVFCENCLSSKLYNEIESVISCPTCKQVTKVNGQGVSSLSIDYVLMNMVEMTAINGLSVLCTSCKSDESAIARCVDCDKYLCSACCRAHEIMRCFDDHEVISIEELKEETERNPTRKPIICPEHKQAIKYFCISCQEAICYDCTLIDHSHPKHVFERIDTLFVNERRKLETIVEETKRKMTNFREISNSLENSLSELQAKHDAAKDLINETYQSYKAVLEKRRDELLQDLNKLHSEQELKIMDAFQEVEKNMDKVNRACAFTSRTLENGSEAEVLAVKRVILTQVTNILSLNAFARPNISITLEFVTNFDKFQRMTRIAFGYLNDDQNQDINSDVFNEHMENGLRMINNNMGMTVMNGHHPSLHSSTSPVNTSPLSAPSSFDGDTNLVGLQSRTPPLPLEGLTTLGEMNLARLASIASSDKDSSASINNEPPIPGSFSLDLLGSDIPANLINNIQALAKLGTANMHDQEIISDGFNGLTSGIGSSIGSAFNSCLDLVNGSSMMNGHTPSAFDTMSHSSSFFPHHSGLNNGSDMINPLEAHQNFMAPFARNTSQRVNPLEIHFKFGQLGTGASHFNSPHGFCIADDDCIVVADTNNHRIQIFTKDGDFVNQFGIGGKIDGQLWYPRKVELLPTGRFVICDRGNERSRLQLFSKSGQFIKKIRLKYVDIVAGMTVTDDGQIVVVDSVQPSLYKLTEQGDITLWFNCSHCMSEPSDVAVRDQRCYICDFKGHSVAIFSETGQYITRIGHQGLTDYPNGIDILNNGNVLVGDSHGNKFHICIFSYNGDLLCEYECPYVKVSRCCGLKVTSEGYIITVAKNNNHVLVLNSPFTMN